MWWFGAYFNAVGKLYGKASARKAQLKDECDEHCKAWGGNHRTPTSKEVLEVKYGKEAPKIVRLCGKEARNPVTGRFDWHDFDEYVSVATVKADGQTIKQAILDYIYGERPMEYGCGPDVYQRSNASGKRVRQKLDIQLKAPVISPGERESALDYTVQQGQSCGRTRSKSAANDWGKGGGWILLPSRRDLEPTEDEEKQVNLWAYCFAMLSYLMTSDPRGVRAFYAIYMGPDFPGARYGGARLGQTCSREELAQEFGVSDEGLTKMAKRTADKLAPYLEARDYAPTRRRPTAEVRRRQDNGSGRGTRWYEAADSPSMLNGRLA